MSRVGDLVVDAGVVLLVTFDGRQSLIGERTTQEPVIQTRLPVRRQPVREVRRPYSVRRPRSPWGRA